MSAALLPRPDTTQAVHDAIRKNAVLERKIESLETDLRSARTRNGVLLRELRRAAEAPRVVGQNVVDGMLTLTYSNGRVMQLQPTAEYSDDSTSYGTRWVELTAPDTPRAILDAVLDQDAPFTGMAVVLG